MGAPEAANKCPLVIEYKTYVTIREETSADPQVGGTKGASTN